MFKEKFFSFLNVLMAVIVMVFICDGGSYEVTNNVVGLVMNAVIIWFFLFILYKFFEHLFNDDWCKNNNNLLRAVLPRGYKTKIYKIKNLDTNEYVMNAQRRDILVFSTDSFVVDKDGVIDFMKPLKKGRYRLEEFDRDNEEICNDEFEVEFEIKDKPFIFIYIDYEVDNCVVRLYKIEDL